MYLKCCSDWLGCAKCLQKCVIPLLHSTLGSSLISWWLCEGSQRLHQASGWQPLIVLLVPNLTDCLPACVCTATPLLQLVLASIHKNTLRACVWLRVSADVCVCVCVCAQCGIYVCGLQSLEMQFAQREIISLPVLTAKVFSFNCKLNRY